MKNALQIKCIGANPPQNSRMWRNPAYRGCARPTVFARFSVACQRGQAGSVPQVLTDAVYHFRTPSPGGHLPLASAQVSTIFCADGECACCGSIVTCAHDAGRFDTGAFLQDRTVPNSLSSDTKELEQWHDAHLSHSPSWVPLASPHVATLSENRRFPALLSAQLEQPFLTGMSARVPLWALSAVSFTVKPSTAAATRQHHRQYCAARTRYERPRAHNNEDGRERLRHFCVGSTTSAEQKGRRSCALNYSPLQPVQHLALPRAETPWRNAPLLAEPLGQGQPLSQAAALSPALPLVQRATWLPVSLISATADHGHCAPHDTFRPSIKRRPASPQGGVLRAHLLRPAHEEAKTKGRHVQ